VFTELLEGEEELPQNLKYPQRSSSAKTKDEK
jgi:hypothetical protein